MKYGQRKRFVKISAAPANYVNMYNPNQPGKILQVHPSQVQKYGQQGWTAPKDGVITGEMLGDTPEQQKNQQKKPILGRIGQGLFGTGLALSNLRNAASYANPNETLYHGTAPANAAAILDGGGLDTRYAGFAKRLNSIMLSDAGGKAVMDAGIDVDDDLLARMTDRATDLMGRSREAGMEGFDSVKAVEQATREVLTQRGMDPQAVEKLITDARPQLQEAGKRIYMANTPRVAGMYGQEGANELHMMGKYLDPSDPMSSLKFQAKALGNILTGGVVPEATRTLDTMKYNRQVGSGINLSGQSTDAARDLMQALDKQQYGQAADLLRKMDPNIDRKAMDRIFQLHDQGALGTTFGVGASRRNMKSLSDFPMLSGLMSLNPGLKYTASDILPSLDPTKDLSVPESIPLQDFRSMDLVDTVSDTPLLRMNFNNPKRAVTLGERAIGLRKAAPFAALGLLGADAVQDAIRQKGMYAGKPFEALMDRRKKKQQEKQAGILSGSTRAGLREAAGVAKSMALPAAVVTGTGIAASKAYGASADFIEKQLETPQMREFKEKEKQRLIAEGEDPRVAEGLASKAARMAVLQVASFPAAIGGGAVAAGVSHPRTIYRLLKGKIPESGKGLMSLPLTALAGYAMTPQMMQRSEEIRMGKDLSDQSPLTMPFKGSKVEKFVRDNPEFAGVPDIATYGTVPLLASFVGKKHYSGHYAKVKREGKEGLQAFAKGINEGGGFNPIEAFRRAAEQRKQEKEIRMRGRAAGLTK